MRRQVVEVMGIEALVVRPATMADLDSVARLADAPGARDRLHTLLADPTRLILLAEIDGQAVGLVANEHQDSATHPYFDIEFKPTEPRPRWQRRSLGGRIDD